MRPHRPGIGKSVFVSTFGSWGKRKIFFFLERPLFISLLLVELRRRI